MPKKEIVYPYELEKIGKEAYTIFIRHRKRECKMRVIIVGASKVGHALAKQVCAEGYDLVVIDRNAEKVDAMTDSFDCNGYVGNGSSPETLKKAGIASASVLVAVTKQDETNILCCHIARKMGVQKTIAAVRGSEYSADHDFLCNQLGIDLIINPDKSAAAEVNKLIRYAGAVEMERFGDGTVNVATVDISGNSILANISMPEIQSRLGAQILVCAIERGGKIVTPKGKHKIIPGDKITFAAIGDEMDKALKQLNILKKVIRKTVIVGGSRVGCYLADMLLSHGVKVTLIEKDREKCQKLLEAFPRVNVITGDGTDTELMEKELKGTDACVAVTGNDEENLIISMFCKSFGLDRIAAEIDNINYENMLVKSGVNHIFSTQDVSLGSIIKSLRSLVTAGHSADENVLKWLYPFNDGKIEAEEFEVGGEFALSGLAFKDPKFTLKRGVLVAVIIRGAETMIPDGNSCIMKGDRIVVVSAEHKITKLTDIIA